MHSSIFLEHLNRSTDNNINALNHNIYYYTDKLILTDNSLEIRIGFIL